MTRRPRGCAAAVLLGAALAAPALAAGAHEHGVARLDIGIDARTVQVSFATPLDNLLGFERAPRTAAERERVAKVVAQLQAGEQLFRFDPAAGCRLAEVELRSAPLQLGPAAKPAAGEHGDLEADWRFDCTEAARATAVEVGLFTFNRLKRLRVQIAGPRGQAQRELVRPATRLALP
jgi:hypothetical protein